MLLRLTSSNVDRFCDRQQAPAQPTICFVVRQSVLKKNIGVVINSKDLTVSINVSANHFISSICASANKPNPAGAMAHKSAGAAKNI